MKENIEEVIEFLQEFNDGYTFQQCQTCFKFNEKDGCCNKEKCEELEAINFLISDYKRVLKESEEWQRAYQEEKDTQFELVRENQKLKSENEELKKERDAIYSDYQDLGKEKWEADEAILFLTERLENYIPVQKNTRQDRRIKKNGFILGKMLHKIFYSTELKLKYKFYKTYWKVRESDERIFKRL